MDFSGTLMTIQDKLPKDAMAIQRVKTEFDKLSDDKKESVASNIAMLKLGNPKLVFWVGSFLFGNFGVGRFMIGDKLLGSVRLILFILCFISAIATSASVVSMLFLDDEFYDYSYDLYLDDYENLYGDIDLAIDDNTTDSIFGIVITGILLFAINIWWIADLFIVGKKLRNNNLEKVLAVIQQQQ